MSTVGAHSVTVINSLLPFPIRGGPRLNSFASRPCNSSISLKGSQRIIEFIIRCSFGGHLFSRCGLGSTVPSRSRVERALPKQRLLQPFSSFLVSIGLAPLPLANISPLLSPLSVRLAPLVRSTRKISPAFRHNGEAFALGFSDGCHERKIVK